MKILKEHFHNNIFLLNFRVTFIFSRFIVVKLDEGSYKRDKKWGQKENVTRT